jgi:uridine kinase
VVTAAAVLELARRRPRTLCAGRLVCIDGPAGSGKTTLAASLSAPTVHMDDLYEGWTGLQAGLETVARDIVAPVSRGETGRYRRYLWQLGRYDDQWVAVPPSELLVIEGCGSGAASYAANITVLVWVEAPYDVRLARGLARDGEEQRDHWLTWMREENELFAGERTRERADLILST